MFFIFQTQEITLRRNGLGQLGFHVHYQGVVVEVDPYGFAWQAGLRKGARLVEVSYMEENKNEIVRK